MKPHSKWTHVLVFDGSCEGLAAPKSQILLALARRHRRIITTSTLHAIDPLLFSCVSQYLRMLARRLAQISNRVVVRFVAGMTLSDRFQLHLSPRHATAPQPLTDEMVQKIVKRDEELRRDYYDMPDSFPANSQPPNGFVTKVNVGELPNG